MCVLMVNSYMLCNALCTSMRKNVTILANIIIARILFAYKLHNIENYFDVHILCLKPERGNILTIATVRSTSYYQTNHHTPVELLIGLSIQRRTCNSAYFIDSILNLRRRYENIMQHIYLNNLVVANESTTVFHPTTSDCRPAAWFN